MSADRNFLDSNLLIYLATEAIKAQHVETLLETKSCVISAQVMNELFSVLRRKYAFSWRDLDDFMTYVELICEIRPVTLDTHVSGRRLAERYGFATYDAMIVAAALEAGCDTLWSEDMHDGLIVDNLLTIRNPFIA